jgi:glycine betaine/proline transport system ATP-binding protein
MSDEQSLIQVSGLYKLFGGNPKQFMPLVHEGKSKDEILNQTGHTLGLKNIDLNIEKGEIFVIMGLSGSGKSTLIRHFNRLIEPTEGVIEVDGIDVMNLSNEELREFRRHKMSMVFQRFGLMPHQTVLDNVAYGLKIQGVKKAERNEQAKQWLNDVGLAGYEDQFPAQLSGGQQQRVGLARALCSGAEIMLMDEAFSALDPLIRTEMQDLLLELQKRLKKTIIFITHDLDEALKLGNHIAILKDGELIQVGESEEILLNPADEYVEAFVRDVNRSKVLTATHVASRKAVTLTTRTQVSKAISMLDQAQQDYAIVLSGKSLIGVVDRHDLTSTDEQEIGGLVQKIFCVTQTDDLESFLPQIIENNKPVAITDEDGDYYGLVSRTKVMDLVMNS